MWCSAVCRLVGGCARANDDAKYERACQGCHRHGWVWCRLGRRFVQYVVWCAVRVASHLSQKVDCLGATLSFLCASNEPIHPIEAMRLWSAIATGDELAVIARFPDGADLE